MSELSMAAALVAVHRRRPPRVELAVTLELANDGPGPRWLLLPDTLATPPREPADQVVTLAGWLLGEYRTIPLLRATADHGWYAVLVPPRSGLTVVGLPLGWWGALPNAVTVTALSVTDLLVGGAPVLAALGLPGPTTADRAGNAEVLTDPGAVVGAVAGAPAEPLGVSWGRAQPLTARLALGTTG
ncbi:hypothetical protein [uncultured Friedmanniella sp.]|uniref:hypothetical protein n=1 Tax=uncultured Friedmanniella sp. TaxID=335381 RepID=UPI0035C98804